MLSPHSRSTLIPCLRYRDAPAAIAWLCATFGFTRQAVYPNADGSIAHAQLTLEGGMIMLGSTFAGEYGNLVQQPGDLGGSNTQSIFVIVADADAVHARAVAAGAKIEIALKDEDYGGRGFTCRDPEGHLWTLGTYDPWAV